MSKNPFARDDVGTGRAGDERPSVVEQKSIVLVLHGAKPVGIEESCLVGVGNRICGRRRGGGGGQIEAPRWKTEAGFATSTHLVIVGRHGNWYGVAW